MGLTAHENENLKEGGAPNMPPENSFYYSWTHNALPFIFKDRRGGEILQPVVICMH